MTSDYRLAPSLAARLLGVILALVGVVVLLLTAAVAFWALSPAVLTAGVVLAAAVVGAAGVALTRRPTVVRLDEEGYRISWVRGAGVARARWSEVEDVVATTVAAERCVVLRLRDGRTTTVPVRMLAGPPDDFVRDLQAHLDRGHGYRRLT